MQKIGSFQKYLPKDKTEAEAAILLRMDRTHIIHPADGAFAAGNVLGLAKNS